MKILSAILVALFLIGCIDEQQKLEDAQYQARNNPVIIIDSCEYLTYRTYGGASEFTHKGNCKFCIQRNKNKDNDCK
jgi:hypothetical protein